MNIVILEGYNSNPGDQSWEPIQQLGNVTIYDRSTQNEIIEKAKDASIIITNKLKITAEVMDALPKLKLIHQLATGTDNIDKEAAAKRNIVVKNAVGYSTHAVSQHVFALILQLTNHISTHNSEVHSGGWTASGDWCHMIKTPFELAGKTIGIIGFGKIGQQVAKIASAFGMKILVVSSHATKNEYPEIEPVDMTTLASQSDIVSIHSPLTEVNKGIINADFLDKMKTTALLINTARGGHIVEEDLKNALVAGSITGAGLDVLVDEPPKADHPLLKLDNCIITPHIAWTAQEARFRLIQIVADNIKKFIK